VTSRRLRGARQAAERDCGGLREGLETDPKNYHASTATPSSSTAGPARNAEEVRRLLDKSSRPSQPRLALNDLGALAIRDGKHAEAQGYLSRAAALEHRPSVQYNLGLALFYGRSEGGSGGPLWSPVAPLQGGVTEGEIYYYVSSASPGRGRPGCSDLFDEKASTMPRISARAGDHAQVKRAAA